MFHVKQSIISCGIDGSVILSDVVLFVRIQQVKNQGGAGGKGQQSEYQQGAQPIAYLFEMPYLILGLDVALATGFFARSGDGWTNGQLDCNIGLYWIFFHFRQTVQTEHLLRNRIPATFQAAQVHSLLYKKVFVLYNRFLFS
jgi:hypothetical protein